MALLRCPLAWFLAAALLLSAPVARAGPVEELMELSFSPANPDAMVLRYAEAGGGGLLYTSDRGKTWSLLCLSAVGSEIEGGAVQLTHDGRTLLGHADGLLEDTGGRCDWDMAPELAGRRIVDMATDPHDPEGIYLLAKSGAGIGAEVIRRDASGSYAALGSPSSADLEGFVVTPLSGSQIRLYELAVAGMARAVVDGVTTVLPRYVIRVSDDLGETFREHELEPTDGTVRLGGVDPRDPDRLVVVVERPGLDEVLVSSDEGASFASYLQVWRFAGLSFGNEGEVWIGDSGDTEANATGGLWTADSLDAEPEQLVTFPVQCLKYQAATDTLYVCQPFQLGTVDVQSGELDPVFRFDEAAGFVTCEGEDPSALCQEQLCEGYCHTGHFPDAPVCAGYDRPGCGPCADGACAPRADGGIGPGASDAGLSETDARRNDAGATRRGREDTGGCAVAARPSRPIGSRVGLVGLTMLLLCRTRRSSRRV